MPDVLEKQAMQHLVKWGIGILGMLIVAGASSLATQNVYSKSEVDAKDTAVKRELNMQIQHMNDVQTIQNEHTNEQLGFIRDDVDEIKEMIKDNQ